VRRPYLDSRRFAASRRTSSSSRHPLPAARHLSRLTLRPSRPLFARLRRQAMGRRSRFLRRKAAARIRLRPSPLPRAKRSTSPLSAILIRPYRHPLPPLTFTKPRARRRPKSAAQKAREAAINIRVKRHRFKRTAQAIDSLTTYMPALMSHLIDRHAIQRRLRYHRTKGLIRATY